MSRNALWAVLLTLLLIGSVAVLSGTVTASPWEAWFGLGELTAGAGLMLVWFVEELPK